MDWEFTMHLSGDSLIDIIYSYVIFTCLYGNNLGLLCTTYFHKSYVFMITSILNFL